jgi:Fe-S cluster assembly protein SufD
MSLPLSKPAPASESPLFPDWFRSQQLEAARRFESSPAPSRKDESWRFASLKALDLSGFTPAPSLAPEATAPLAERSLGFSGASASLVFANDRLIHQTRAQDLPQGVLLLPLSEALQKHSDLVQSHFMREEGVLGAAKFNALHRSSLRNGTFLYLPKNVRLKAPIQAFHWLSGGDASVFPHTLILAEEGSSVTFLDWFESAGSERGLSCGVNDLWVSKDASIQYLSIQQWSREVLSIHSNTTQVAEGGSALSLALQLGGRFSRSESVSHLNAPGARSEMLAITVSDGHQEFDQRTLQDHRSPKTASDLLYKNALYDTAKTIFSGLIRVGPEAHQTDAYQKVRNLVLSDEAEANSMPGLEILADQVRCSHGATTGEINPEELFYLLSRGIPKHDAYRLITFGFLNEVLERLPDPDIRSCLQDTLRQRLRGH